MKHLGTISFEEASAEERKEYRQRRAARAIVRDDEGNIALLAVTKHNYHKLPGGGIEQEEREIEALKRECLEEIGCAIDVDEPFGQIEEFRDKIKVHQISVCYTAKVVGEKGQPDFTQKELDKGFKIIWVPAEKAIEVLRDDQPNDYEGPFIQKRDLLFLEEALKK